MKKSHFAVWALTLSLGLLLTVLLLPRFVTGGKPTSLSHTATQRTAETTAPVPTAPSTTAPPPTIKPQPPTLEQLFPTYEVTATLLEATPELPKGYKGRVRNGKSGVFYRIYGPNGEALRVDWDKVNLSPPPTLDLPDVDKATIEKAVNEWGFLSKTDYLVWTNLYRLETYVFGRTSSGWQLLKRLDCSAGDLYHPTPVGQYEVEQKLPAIGKAGQYTCPNAVGFWGNYLFHSVPLDPTEKTVLDGRMRVRVSNGCVRLRPEDSLWLYQTVPIGTAVYIR